jgi:hypothetical protein
VESGESPDQADPLVWRDMVDPIGYDEVLRQLDPLPIAVLQRVLDQQPLYTEASLQQLSAIVGESVKVHRVQNALRRLESIGIVGWIGRGEPIIEDDLLNAWLLERRKQAVD